MSARPALPLALWALACGLASAQVEGGRAAESAASGNPAAAGASLRAAPAPIALNVAPLSAGPLFTAPAVFTPAPLAASPAAGPRLAPPLAAPAAPPVSAAPAAVGAAAELPRAGVPSGAASESAQTAANDDGDAESAGAASGRALFDASAPAANDNVGLWIRLKGWAKGGDRVPDWPGKPGETVRLNGRSFALGRRLPDGGSAALWKVERGDYVVKILPSVPSGGGEAAILKSIRNTDIPHAGLIAASADGRVIVKDLAGGDGAAKFLAAGFEDRHSQGWAELAAKLIRAGASADLSPDNLIWEHWRTRWTIVDATGVEAAGPEKVLAQLLAPRARRAGIDAAGFLAEVRGRLGPDSPAWARTLAVLNAPDRAALEARDRSLPPPPVVVFGPPPAEPPYPDRAATTSEPAKALGYDPLAVQPRRALHADDPGKLNTEVFAVEPPGRTGTAVKIADWSMIRRELALRRVIRRWFGRWFDAPSAFGVRGGRESYLVMELKSGSPSFSRSPLTREQRAALAVLVHAFGVGDMNPGNVLFPPDARPVLLDFEVALTRLAPNASRLPDEGIALEMPWMSRSELNRAEDYQPAVRAWRELLAEPASKDALREDFEAAGYSAEEAADLLAVVEKNTADLDWSIQNDADFVNQFVPRRGR
jgi:hypothetical protein